MVVSEETGRISVAAFGELQPAYSLPEVEKRINRHFEVTRPATLPADDFAADVPLATDGAAMPVDIRATDKVKQP